MGGRNTGNLRRGQIPAHRRQVGFVFQDHRLLDDRPVYDNVALPLAIGGVPRREMDKRVRAALDQVGLLGRERSFPLELSAGEQQRVGIARAVITRPPVLVADEPTAGIDVSVRGQVVDVIASLQRDRGASAIIISHDLDVLRRSVDRIAVLHEGMVVGLGTIDEVLDDPHHPYVQGLARTVSGDQR